MKKSMNPTAILLTILFLGCLMPGALQAEDEPNTCLKCHLDNDLMPQGYFAEDVHEQQGLSCAGCHGGDPSAEDMEEAMSAENGYIGVPAKQDIPAFCGGCHSKIEIMRVYQPRIPTDQVQQYYTSRHGRQLQTGDQQVAQCVSCHSAHKILPARDPRSSVHPFNIPATCDHCHGNSELMVPRGHTSHPLTDYARSVHGVALLEKRDAGAPACNDCHGNHGAAPPGAESVAHICGSCHLNNLAFFRNSKMGDPFNSPEYHSCEQCHGNHAIMAPSDEYLNVEQTSICLECHSSGDEGYETAEIMYERLRTSDKLYQDAQDQLRVIQIKGMNDVDIQYLLQESKQNLIQTHTLVHTFDADQVSVKAQEGMELSQQALNLAGLEISKFNKRRLGFGLSTLAFVLLALAVYLKIRAIDNGKTD